MGGLSTTPVPYVPQTEELQVGDHRLRTSCGVVEQGHHHNCDQADHHCGYDLAKSVDIGTAVADPSIQVDIDVTG